MYRLQVEAWVSHIPGVVMWQQANSCVQSFARRPGATVMEATSRCWKRFSWAKNLVSEVTGAAMRGDAQKVTNVVREQVPFVDHLVVGIAESAGEWNKRWNHLKATCDGQCSSSALFTCKVYFHMSFSRAWCEKCTSTFAPWLLL